MRQAPRCRHLANRTGCPGGLRCFLPVLYLYLYNLSGAQLAPPDTDTGLTVLTPDYLSQFLENSRCPILDTLFLAVPVAFKRRLVQYAGRILRAHPGKTTAEITTTTTPGLAC